jgi:S1-C subfamily serine protease
MKPGRSSSEGVVIVALAVALAWGLVCAAAPSWAQNAPVTPAAVQPPAAIPPSRPAVCPRCGYVCDASWQFCPACGWDRRVLVGAEAEARRQALTRATVGLTLVRSKEGLRERMSDKEWKLISRYFTHFTGQQKFWATAFPFGPAGFYATSARVLEDVDEVKIRTADNLEYAGHVVGVDAASGIGVLKAEVPGSTPMQAAGTGPKTSEGLYAICYGVGKEEDGELVRYLPVSLHYGEVSATGQSGTDLTSFEGLIRTDHSLPGVGCLGSPLVDRRGDLVGMIVGLMDAGIIYSVSVDALTTAVGPLSEGRSPARPYFGLGLVTVDARRRARFHTAGTVEHPMVGFLVPESPAAKAGVQAGDILVSVEGQDVVTVSEAGARLLAAKTGGAVNLGLKRGGEEVQVPVQTTQRPQRILLDPVDEIQESLEANLVEVSTGPTSQQGLKVIDLARGGRGEHADFKEGDVIVAVNGTALRRLDTFSKVIRSSQGEVFRPADAGGGARDTYHISLDVHTVDGESVHRRYSNLFPEVLAPPGY